MLHQLEENAIKIDFQHLLYLFLSKKFDLKIVNRLKIDKDLIFYKPKPWLSNNTEFERLALYFSQQHRRFPLTQKRSARLVFESLISNYPAHLGLIIKAFSRVE